MSRKERFLMFVLLAEAAGVGETSGAYQVVLYALRLREEAIPPNLCAAALVFVRHFHKRGPAFKWMRVIE